jgi:ubiquinol-cytochrome c reductase cytochrome b subunit
MIKYPTPSNLTGNWNWGVLAGMCLVLQILTGIFLAMHYTAHVDLAFSSVQHIMRDVPSGWLLRYLHANGASLFFIVVYMHLFRGLYYTSYAQPRELVWLLGVVILLIMILTAFIGYVLPWGDQLPKMIFYSSAFYTPKTLALNRIGPHQKHILCFLHGALLGDAHAEKHGNGTRFSFHHSVRQVEFLYWMQKYLADRGYCLNKKRKITKTINKNSKIYYSMKFSTFTFSSLNWIRESFYDENNRKRITQEILQYLSPLAIAIWIMGDGHFTGNGLLICTNCFTLEEVRLLQTFLQKEYGISPSLHRKKQNYCIYIKKENLPNMISKIEPFMHKSMLYKLGIKKL